MQQSKTSVQKRNTSKDWKGWSWNRAILSWGTKDKNCSDLVSSAGFHQLPVCLLSLRPKEDSQVNYSPKTRLMKPPLENPELVCPPPQCHNLTACVAEVEALKSLSPVKLFFFPSPGLILSTNLSTLDDKSPLLYTENRFLDQRLAFPSAF